MSEESSLHCLGTQRTCTFMLWRGLLTYLLKHLHLGWAKWPHTCYSNQKRSLYDAIPSVMLLFIISSLSGFSLISTLVALKHTFCSFGSYLLFILTHNWPHYQKKIEANFWYFLHPACSCQECFMSVCPNFPLEPCEEGMTPSPPVSPLVPRVIVSLRACSVIADYMGQLLAAVLPLLFDGI